MVLSVVYSTRTELSSWTAFHFLTLWEMPLQQKSRAIRQVGHIPTDK
nr:MAG TPA: hypothetical protein [Caudoviricetes sp.]